MKSSSLVPIVALTVFVGACGAGASAEPASTATPSTTTAAVAAEVTTSTVAPVVAGQGRGQGMGRTSGMMERHQATIPADYAGATNPIAADEESLARGAEAYAMCASCHGDGGLGDGAAAVALDPAPVNIAHTSQMMSDAYLLWRISEGGAQFDTSMPAWGEVLDEETMWDLINYIRALGAGTAMPGRGPGGGAGNPGAQAVQQAALLAAAVEQGIITQDESDAFAAVHDTVDAAMAELRGTTTGSPVNEMLPDVLAELVASGDLTQNQADTFLSVHNRLSEAGLLP